MARNYRLYELFHRVWYISKCTDDDSTKDELHRTLSQIMEISKEGMLLTHRDEQERAEERKS